MSHVSAEQLIIESGKSSELVSAFQMVAEAEVEGQPKYSQQTCRDLAKAIACRNYSRAVLELCHLVHIAEKCGGGQGYELFFWDSGPARPSALRANVLRGFREGQAGRGVTVTGAGVDVAYDDGKFSVTFGRMPFLMALMEFLITTIGYAELNAVLRDMLEPSINSRSVSAHANRLSRLIYDYLKEHLPSAQNQRKFRRLIAFMEERRGGDFAVDAIDDTVVLDFWTSESAKESADGVDFRMFQTVFKTFLRLRQTLEQSADLHALETSYSIGVDREAGEIDPDAIYGIVETVDEYRSPLAALQEPPADAIKFLNQRETGQLELLFESGAAAFVMPLSLMRCEVFGKGQGQITQALRRRADARRLRTLIVDCAPETYRERQDAFVKLHAHLDRVLLASLHVLARNRRREAINLVVSLRPEIDFSPLARLLDISDDGDDRVVVLRAASVSDQFLNVIEDSQKVGPDIADLIAEARKAYRGLSRQGFGDDMLDDPDTTEGFALGAGTLLDMSGHVTAFAELLDRAALPEADWDGQFEADKRVFSDQFTVLYGGTP